VKVVLSTKPPDTARLLWLLLLFVACKEEVVEEEEEVEVVVLVVEVLLEVCSGSIDSCLTVTGVVGVSGPPPNRVTLLSPSSLSALLLHFCAADGQDDVTFGHTFILLWGTGVGFLIYFYCFF
jgi:hypothetical protein